MSDTLAVVQFPHPGREYRTKEPHAGGHTRKFLVANGKYRDGRNRSRESELVFWGEWEGPSDPVRDWSKEGGSPGALHRPFWANSMPRLRMNTDPWVFGERMLYSNCKQASTTSMQRLSPGSVIVFGSTIRGEFCVDTVFVVHSKEPWVPGRSEALDVDDSFRACTIVPTCRTDRNTSFMLYRGATADEPFEGMYSFVPARRADDPACRFERPAIMLRKYINPANRQSTWGSKTERLMTEVRKAWESIRNQVFDTGLLLGVSFETPARKRVPNVVSGGGCRVC